MATRKKYRRSKRAAVSGQQGAAAAIGAPPNAQQNPQQQEAAANGVPHPNDDIHPSSPVQQQSDEATQIHTHIPMAYLWAFSIFLAAVAVVAPYGQSAFGYNPDLYMASLLQVGALAMLFGYLLINYQNKTQSALLPRHPLLYPLVLFYLWMVVSLLWTANLYEGLVKVLDWGAAGIIFFLVLVLVRDYRALFPMVFCLFCSLVIVSLLGLSQYLISFDWIVQHRAPAATFANKNTNAEYLVITLLLGAGLFLNSRRPAALWFYGLGTAPAIAVLFYTQARGAWISFVVEAAILALLLAYMKYAGNKFYWNRAKVIALLGAFIVAFALVNTPFRFFTYHVPIMEKNTGGINKTINPTGNTARAKSAAGVLGKAVRGYEDSKIQRLAMWQNSAVMFKDHWLLGVGVGSWMVFYPKYQQTVEVDPLLSEETFFHINAHNDYIEFACELGIVGVLLMLWLIAAIVRSLWRVAVHCGALPREYRTLVLVVAASITGVASNAFFGFPLQQPITIALALAYLAIVINAASLSSVPKARSFSRNFYCLPIMPQRRHWRLAALAASGVAVAAMLSLHALWQSADRLYYQAVSKDGAAQYDTAYQVAQAAYERLPIRKHALYYIGGYYYQNQQYAKALPLFEELHRAYPYSRRALNPLAGIYLQLGKVDEFDQIIRVWEETRPQSALAQLNKAIGAYNRNDPEKAYTIVRRAGDFYGTEETQKRLGLLAQQLRKDLGEEKTRQLDAALEGEQKVKASVAD